MSKLALRAATTAETSAPLHAFSQEFLRTFEVVLFFLAGGGLQNNLLEKGPSFSQFLCSSGEDVL